MFRFLVNIPTSAESHICKDFQKKCKNVNGTADEIQLISLCSTYVQLQFSKFNINRFITISIVSSEERRLQVSSILYYLSLGYGFSIIFIYLLYNYVLVSCTRCSNTYKLMWDEIHKVGTKVGKYLGLRHKIKSIAYILLYCNFIFRL